MPEHDPVSVVRRSYQAYVDKDRAALELLIGDDFHFTSPLDDHIDRANYFERCWPNSETIAKFNFVHLITERDRVFATYEGSNFSGKRFRNTEILTVHDGKIVDVEVYFGWSIPRQVAPDDPKAS